MELIFVISAVLDQVDDILLKEPTFTRRYVIEEMKKRFLNDEISPGFFEPSPDIYFKKMIRPGVYCDHIFMTFFSLVLQRDFAVFNVHTAQWSHIYGKQTSFFPSLRLNHLGGQLLSEVSGAGPPVFLAHFDEDNYISPHYQSIVPTSGSRLYFHHH